MQTSLNQLINRTATLYVKGLAVYAAYSLLEIPFHASIKAARVAESNFRKTLPSAISTAWIWSYGVETLLYLPVVSAVTCLFLKIFARAAKEPMGLDHHWLKKDYDKVLAELDRMFETPEGITWKPRVSNLAALEKLDSTLFNYTLDLSYKAFVGELSPFCGRTPEVKEIANILKRKTKNIPLLVGPHGVGKKAIIGGLARQRRVLLLTWESLIDGKSYNASENLRKLRETLIAQRTEVVVCIDDLDSFVSHRNEIEADLRKFMTSGFPCIAISNKTHPFYQLEDLFHRVEVSNPIEDDLLQILRHKRSELEVHYRIRISDEALNMCVYIAKNHLPKEVFPKKAIELLDEAASTRSAEINSTPDEEKNAKYLALLLRLQSLTKNPEKFDQKVAEVRNKFQTVIGPDEICKLVGLQLKTPAEANLDSLLEARNFKELFLALEEMMRTPEGIRWTPSPPQVEVSHLPKPLEYLSQYARDLTLEAAQGKLLPFYGREKEFQNIAEILGRSQKNNPLLLGAPGVGKTAMAEGLAQLMLKNDETLPMPFRGKRLFLLQWDRLKSDEKNIAGNLAHILQEAQVNKSHLILFIDNIHTFIGQKSKTADILKAALTNGSIACISTTTPWDFKRMINEDPVIERKFPIVELLEQSEEEVINLLKKLRPEIEAHNAVRISDEAIQVCYTLGKRYLKSNSFPDKGIDFLLQAASRLKMKYPPCAEQLQIGRLLGVLLRINFNDKIEEVRARLTQVVSPDLIREVVAEKVEIPIQNIQESERDLLRSLEERMSRKIIGQTHPIKALCQAVRRGRVGMNKADTPAGVFLMLGTTGVGKTASARALANILYGSEHKLLRLDMSEFKEKIDINKLIGAPPGYVGYDQGGRLTKWLSKNPTSIVLFDEIEKAHPEVFDLLLQLFDAGRLTDAYGETVNCLETIFIMTSNLGANEIQEKHKTSLSEEDLLEQVQPVLAAQFKPEFINRIQQTIIFYPLTENEVQQIVRLQLKEFKTRAEKNSHCANLTITWDDSLVDYLTKTGYKPDKGARELSRRITTCLENPLADLIIKAEVNPGDQLLITSDGKTVNIQINKINYIAVVGFEPTTQGL